MSKAALDAVNWDALDAMTDSEIERQIAADADVAPEILPVDVPAPFQAAPAGRRGSVHGWKPSGTPIPHDQARQRIAPPFDGGVYVQTFLQIHLRHQDEHHHGDQCVPACSRPPATREHPGDR